MLSSAHGVPEGQVINSDGELVEEELSYPPPIVVPHPREDGPPPPSGGRSPSDAPPPPPPPGDRSTAVHSHLPAQKLQHKTKEFSIRYVQRGANVRRPTP